MRGALAIAGKIPQDAAPDRSPRRNLGLQKGRKLFARHCPFHDAPSDVWRCAWCASPACSKERLEAKRCRGAPLHFRMLFKQQCGETSAEPVSEVEREHVLWQRGGWTWCSVCCGISRCRLKVLGKPCLAAPKQTRIDNVKRLTEGFTPYGVKAPLAGDRPQKVLAGQWLDTTFSDAARDLRNSQRQCLQHSLPADGAESGSLESDLPLAFVQGLRSACRLLTRSLV